MQSSFDQPDAAIVILLIGLWNGWGWMFGGQSAYLHPGEMHFSENGTLDIGVTGGSGRAVDGVGSVRGLAGVGLVGSVVGLVRPGSDLKDPTEGGAER